MGPLAVLTCATLVLTALRPGLAASLVIFSLSAAFGVYQIAANTAFVVRVPNERRAQAFGIANMGVIVGQGAAFVAAGAAAEVVAPAVVIAVAGRCRGDSWFGADAQVASRVTAGRASCGGTASRSRHDEKFRAAPRVFLAVPLQQRLRAQLKSMYRALHIPFPVASNGKSSWSAPGDTHGLPSLCNPFTAVRKSPGAGHAG